MRLQDQRIVIIGGSTGIGYETARRALEEGASGVLLIGRNAGKLGAAQQALGGPDRVQIATADVADTEAIARVFASLETVDHVYVAAGTLSAGAVATTDPAAYVQGVNERIWGYIGVVRAAVPKLARTGSLTFTSGMLSQRPSAGTAFTTMLASAVEGLVRALPLEVAPIRVNALVPGMVETPLIDALLGDNKEAAFAAEAKRLPIGRAGTAAECADAAIFLMTNHYINGESLYVHGGGRYA